MALLLGCFLIFLSTIPVVLTRAILDRRRNGESWPAPRGAAAAPWILLVISAFNILLVTATVWTMFYGMPNELMDVHIVLKLGLGLGVVAAVLTVGALLNAVLAWKNNYWGRPNILLACDGRGDRICLVPELLEPVRLAVLISVCDSGGNAGPDTWPRGPTWPRA
jgi:hypothetical protein